MYSNAAIYIFGYLNNCSPEAADRHSLVAAAMLVKEITAACPQLLFSPLPKLPAPPGLPDYLSA